jgi:tetratricopeptide (TPR) repeat protein
MRSMNCCRSLRFPLAVLLLGGLSAFGLQQSGTPAATPVPTTGADQTAHGFAQSDTRADAYYHYMLAREYAERAETTERAEDLNRALEEYRLAMHADPANPYIPQKMASLLFRSGQTGDGIRLAQSIEREHPNDPDIHRLLGEIYRHLLGDDSNAGTENRNPELLRMAVQEYEQLEKLEPSKIENWLILGALYRQSHKPDLAQAQFQQALNLDHSSESAVAGLIGVYADEDNLTAAVKVLNTVPAGARTASMYVAAGAAYERAHDDTRAADEYKNAVLLEPDNLDYHNDLAQALFRSGQLRQALAEYQLVANSHPDDPQIWVQMSKIHRRQGDYREAEDDLAKASQLQPDDPGIEYYTSRLYASEGKTLQAIGILNDLLKKSERPDGKYSDAEISNRGIFLEDLGTLQRQDGDYAAAVQTFRQMGTLGADNEGRAYEELAETYRQQHQFGQAAQVAAEGLAKLPSDRALRGVYGSMLADSGRVDDGLTQLRGMLTGTPADFDVYELIAQINERAARWQDAINAAKKAESIAQSDEQRAGAEFMMGSVFERQKKYAPAELKFKNALALDPHNAMILNYYGYMLTEEDVRLPEALNYIQQAIHNEAGNGAYLDSLGWLYYKMNRLDDATVNLERAAELERDDPVILDHLATVYYHTGHLREAEADWTRALQQWQTAAPGDSDAGEIAKVKKQIESLRVRLAHSGPVPSAEP